MKNAFLALFAGAALMACSPASEPAPETPMVDPAASMEPAQPSPVTATMPTDDECGASQHAALVGKPATDPGVPAESRDVRHIRPDSQVTMDFSPQRLNVDIDAAGVITGFRCG
jgi:hypothetical protein